MKLSTVFALCGLLVAAEEECYLPIDIMFLQDTTGSFEEDLPIVLRQIPDMVNLILETHPKSWFGVAEFKDKPYYPLGEPNDFCYKLGDGQLSPLMDDFEWAYSLLYASGGGDLPEAQFQALIDIALDPAVGWRPLATERAADEHESGARIVIMSTDAPPHLPGDIEKYNHNDYPDLPQNLPPNVGTISTGDVDYECLFQDYPSDLQMAAAIKSQNIHLVILTPDEKNITGAWSWVNEELLGQPEGFYQFISEDSSDILEAVLRAVASVTEYACPTAGPTTETVPTMPSIIPPETTLPTSTVPTTIHSTTLHPTQRITTSGNPTPAPSTQKETTSSAPVEESSAPVEESSAPVEESTTPGATAPPVCPPCPPCTETTCPPCDPCNHGIVIKIGKSVEKLELSLD